MPAEEDQESKQAEFRGESPPSPVTTAPQSPLTTKVQEALKGRKVKEAEISPVTGISEMLVGHGVDLSKWVLCITGGAIVLLLSYLVAMELIIGWNVQSAYKPVLNPSPTGAEFYALGRLERFEADLEAARQNSAQSLEGESLQNAQGVLKTIGLLPSVTSGQKVQLNACVPIPTDSSRKDKLTRCIGIVEAIRQAAVEAAASANGAQLAGDAATKIFEQRQSLHQFWVQAAQLILLNLLLPLLTALFGYIFGRGSVERQL